MLGDDDFGAPCGGIGNDGVPVEGFVGDECAEAYAADQGRHADRVKALSGKKHEAHEICRARLSSPGLSSSCCLWNGRWLGSKSPFCARAVPVNLDDGGIHHRVFHIRLLRDGFEEPGENVLDHPVTKPCVDRAPVAEHCWKIPPRAPSSHDPKLELQTNAMKILIPNRP